MKTKTKVWTAFTLRKDLKNYSQQDALLLYALQLKYGLDDVTIVANDSLTDGHNDKKVDMIHIDEDLKLAIIAQGYVSQDMNKREAKSNKASDLNTGITWLISQKIEEVPDLLRTHAEELRKAIQENIVDKIQIWYVHNLPESKNVNDELKIVEKTLFNSLKSGDYPYKDVEIISLEVGINRLEEWYQAIITPILIEDKLEIIVHGGFKVKGVNWSSYVTTVSLSWFYELYKEHGASKLFSANIREFLGYKETDNNINNCIRETAEKTPSQFWIYNNGITALVHNFTEKPFGKKKKLIIDGISIVNGAQTTGSVGSLNKKPSSQAQVNVRFITCNSPNILLDVVRYNNNQNRILSPDFRSKDAIQVRLKAEFEKLKNISYIPRRSLLTTKSNTKHLLPSIVAGQALASFHKTPHIAYHGKTKIWDDSSLYYKYFTDRTTAEHILFTYSLLKAVDEKKRELKKKFRDNKLLSAEEKQFEFLKKRGSTFLFASAIARSLEVILNSKINNYFHLKFKKIISIEESIKEWNQIVNTTLPFANYLVKGLNDGFKSQETVDEAVEEFTNLVQAIYTPNKHIFDAFKKNVKQ